MTVQCRFIPPEEYTRICKEHQDQREAIKAAHPEMSWTELSQLPEMRIHMRDNFFPPGSMWYAPWYTPWDHEPDMNVEEKIKELLALPKEKRFLSSYYLRDWALKRPPIVVVLPKGGEWCCDQVASNGDGWKVTGEVPNITCHPSIGRGNPTGKTTGYIYHGFLRNGVFTDHIG